MFGWLRNRLRDGGAGTTVPERVLSTSVDYAPVEEPEVQEEAFTEADVDRDFFALLVGAEEVSTRSLVRIEIDALNSLRVWISNADSLSNQVPRMPALLPQLLRSLNSGDGADKELVKLVRSDPTMVAEVVRTANSPYYRTLRKVTSIERAVIVLGGAGMRETIARIVLHPIIRFDAGFYNKALAALIWEQANKAAGVCGVLAEKRGVERFHAFLAGLMHNVGATVLFRALGRELGGAPLPACEAFRRVVEATVPLLSCRIALEWDLPRPVVMALNPKNGDLPLRRILSSGVRLSRVHSLIAKGRYDGDWIDKRWLNDPELSVYQDAALAELERYAPSTQT